MPAASSHFAEMPVPAPPPMMGSPRATMSWNFCINVWRSCLAISTPLVCIYVMIRFMEQLDLLTETHVLGDDKIGRASCRERVEGWVGGVAVNDKKEECSRRR